MGSLLQDLRYAVRVLARSPGFTTAAVLTLTLGIGANTAIFSVVNSVLLRRLPYRDPSHLVIVWEHSTQPGPNVASPADFLDWQSQNKVFASMAAVLDDRENLTGNGEPEQVIMQQVSPNFFSVLGVNPALGRGFIGEDGQAGKDNVVILSHGLWKTRFGGNPGIVGQTIEINGHSQTVVGVAPENFDWFIKQGSLTNAKPQLWSPLVFRKEFRDRRLSGRFMTVVGRLKPNVTLRQAQAEMTTIAARLAQEYPDFNGHWGVEVVPLSEQLSGDLRPALLILFGAVGFVLLIACANVSSLLLSRAAGREKEIAIRVAIGADRWRIAGQLLTENLLLAVIGGGIGVALAVMGTNALLAASPKNLLDVHSVSIDIRVLIFAVATTLLAGFIFGFLPAYFAAHSGVLETLKEGGRGSSEGKRRQIARGVFVVAQVSLALVLLAGSGLLIRSFVRLIGVDPGFDANKILTFTLTLPGTKYKTEQSGIAFFQQFLTRVARLPGVRSVSMNSFPPLTGLGAETAVHILGQPERSLMDLPDAAVRVVGPDYLRTLSIPLLAGRTFNSQEMGEPHHVVLVNQAFAHEYLSGTNPIGQKAVIFMKSLVESDSPPSEIIGVVGDVREMGLDSPAKPTVYWPYPELTYSRMTILVRTSNDPLALVPAVRSELKQMDPEQPISNIATMEQLLADSLSRSRFTMLLLGLLAIIALVLAAVGIYGVIAYSVTQRTHDIGIRLALGAQRHQVLGLVLRQGIRLALAGVVVGLICALSLTRLLSSLLYGMKPTDPATFVGVVLLLLGVAILASYIPARRAMNVDPMVALRYE